MEGVGRVLKNAAQLKPVINKLMIKVIMIWLLSDQSQLM